MAIRLATGWDPHQAEVVVGTSSGAFVTALLRNRALDLDFLVRPEDGRDDVAERIRSHVYTRGGHGSVGQWLRHGVVPGMRRPGLTFALGSPAPYSAQGIADWVITSLGPGPARSWPAHPTAIVAYDLMAGQRIAFGTMAAPDITLCQAVAASSAIPLLFSPYQIEDRAYVDGGVTSGTHADLVLGAGAPLDLVLILAPMAASEQRRRSRFYERMFDRVGLRSLAEELDLIRSAWPDVAVLTLGPPPVVQAVARPNPMDASRSVATFMRTLIAMKVELARPETWDVLQQHLVPASATRATG